MTSRYVEIRPDNIPSDGKISFKNGFPVLSFTISAQDGLLDPSTVRIVGDFCAYKDNLTTPTPLRAGDNTTMNSRLGIYNLLESLTVKSQKSKMACETIRHFSKFLNTYFACTSSLQDQMGHLAETCLIMPNPENFIESVMESPAGSTQVKPFSFHVASGFMQSGNMVNLRPDAFGGVILEFLLQPDSNVFFNTNGSTTGIGDCHYELTNLKLTCEVSDIPDGQLSGNESQGVYEFNSITSLYTSVNSTNAQIQYSLGLRNVLSAFMTFVPVSHINTLTADGHATTYMAGDGTSLTNLAPFKKIQFLKGGSKYPAEFDYDNSFVVDPNTELPDPQVVRLLVEAINPEFTQSRVSISPVNFNRNYNLLASSTAATSYVNIAEGGAVMGVGIKYGIGGAGEDFSNEQWGVSLDSELKSNNPMGVYIFVKSRVQVAYSPNGIQVLQ